MRNSLAAVLICCLVLSISSRAVGHDQHTPVSKAKLRARVEAEVEELARKTPADPRLREQIGGFGAKFLRFFARFGLALAAEAFPVEWFAHSEILWPLEDTGMVPKYVVGVKPVSPCSGNVVIVLRYGIEDKPTCESPGEQAKINGCLDAMKLSGPLFERTKPDPDMRVLFVRDFSSQLRDTAATVVIRCKVREQKTGHMYELVALEEWQFKPSENRQQQCWRRFAARYYLSPGGRLTLER